MALDKYRLFEMTRPEVEEILQNGIDTVIVTFGATEQHGLHLPLGTDFMWGEALGDRVAKTLGDALLAPGLRVGCSEHHMTFAGSLSLREDTFARVIEDLTQSLARHGFKNLVLLPTHGGNFAPLERAVKRVAPQLKQCNLIAYTDLMRFVEVCCEVGEAEDIPSEKVGGHAGEHETSLILALYPELVQMRSAQPGYVGSPTAVAQEVFERGFRVVTENGVLGDPRPATAAQGERYLQAMSDEMVAFIRAARSE